MVQSGTPLKANRHGNRELHVSAPLARTDLFALAAIERCGIHLPNSAWGWKGGLSVDDFSRGLRSYGTLVPYCLAGAGNGQELNMLDVIAGMPSIIPQSTLGLADNAFSRWNTGGASIRSTILSALVHKTAGAPAGYLMTLNSAPERELYSRLLGVSEAGESSFERAWALSDEDMAQCLEGIFYNAPSTRKGKRPTFSEWVCLVEEGVIALAVSQSHIFLERGADPHEVFELSKRRIRAFLSFAEPIPHLETVVRVGASAPFLVDKWRAAAPFILEEDLGGIDIPTARAIDGKKKLDVLKLAPGLLGGPLSFFDTSDSQAIQHSVFDAFKTRKTLQTLAGGHMGNPFATALLSRTASYMIGKKLPAAEIFAYPNAQASFRNTHQQAPAHLSNLHPLVGFKLGWADWVDQETCSLWFPVAVAELHNDTVRAEELLKLFSESWPEAYDQAYQALKASGRPKKQLQRAGRFVTPGMPSFRELNEMHWERQLKIGLGL